MTGDKLGERKKIKYVYYHCGNLDPRCRRKHVREEGLEQRFSERLGRLRFDDEVLGWITEALKASRSEQHRAHEEALCRLRTEYDGLEAEMDTVYEDKILRRISVEL